MPMVFVLKGISSVTLRIDRLYLLKILPIAQGKVNITTAPKYAKSLLDSPICVVSKMASGPPFLYPISASLPMLGPIGAINKFNSRIHRCWHQQFTHLMGACSCQQKVVAVKEAEILNFRNEIY